MEAETNKRIAEALGYEAEYSYRHNLSNPKKYVTVPHAGFQEGFIFNPKTDDTQLWECVERFKLKIEWVEHRKGWVVNQRLSFTGKTPKEAVIAALNEMFGKANENN